MTRPRSAVLLATILILVYWAAHQPRPVEAVEVKHCPITEWMWVEIDGERLRFFYKTFGPCSLMDRYEEA